ncbi:MAG: hypothetical protein A2V88_16020 [Elusimicrobia bacterium RBG_16_66_12]|nr:MAG: hypothetical protein A2V88_16020 [Elusimicrobia bacterium RBG_16_66_12]
MGYVVMALGMLPGIGLAVFSGVSLLVELQKTPDNQAGGLLLGGLVVLLVWAGVAVAGTIPGLLLVVIGKAAEKNG